MKQLAYFALFLCCLLLTNSTLTAQSELDEFPWLNDVVNRDNCCENQRIIVYQSGIFSFIYIEKDKDCALMDNALYFQDGTFYCQDINDFDCRMAYGLTEENARVLWDCSTTPEEVTTLTICAGESVFLKAAQTFPTPPQGPAGPNGELPSTPCTPQLSSIDISPQVAEPLEDLSGFMVQPTEDTKYTVTSKGICGGPRSSNSDEIVLNYTVLVDGFCEEVETCEDVLESDWLKRLLASDCTGNIYNVTFKDQAAVYVQTLCACVDATDMVYDCLGQELCSSGGFMDPKAACDSSVITQLTTKNLIRSPECDCPCPVDFTPVCGVDGKTYESACEATCAGVEIADRAACTTDNSCAALDALNINPGFCDGCISEVAIYEFEGAEYVVTMENNPICSDGITTVTNCDSTVAFCQDGGIAGFSQCERFFAEAKKIRTVWSSAEDCEVIIVEVAEPCTDLAKVDFGLCQAVMGVGLVNGKCQFISGCLNTVVNGIDYSEALFPSVEICQQTCEQKGEPSSNDEAIFTEFAWLNDLIDTNNCEGTTVEVYDLGAFSYVHVQTSDMGVLYYEDGTFYCMDLVSYDCRSLYELTEDKRTGLWTCEPSRDGPKSPDNGRRLAPKTTVLQPTVGFKIFPNPTRGLLNVQIERSLNAEFLVTVYHPTGRVVERKQVFNTNLTLDLSNEAPGIYLVEWQNGENRIVRKVVKE
ncbi:MAG: T9SS type A sorting domain-containing protein [Bacteroidota bacterium]